MYLHVLKSQTQPGPAALVTLGCRHWHHLFCQREDKESCPPIASLTWEMRASAVTERPLCLSVCKWLSFSSSQTHRNQRNQRAHGNVQWLVTAEALMETLQKRASSIFLLFFFPLSTAGHGLQRRYFLAYKQETWVQHQLDPALHPYLGKAPRQSIAQFDGTSGRCKSKEWKTHLIKV